MNKTISFYTRCKACGQAHATSLDVAVVAISDPMIEHMRQKAEAEINATTCKCGKRDFDPVKVAKS